MVRGPSMASVTAATEVAAGSCVSLYPPWMPWCEVSNPDRTSRVNTLAISSTGMSYFSAISRALASRRRGLDARCFIAIKA